MTLSTIITLISLHWHKVLASLAFLGTIYNKLAHGKDIKAITQQVEEQKQEIGALQTIMLDRMAQDIKHKKSQKKTKKK